MKSDLGKGLVKSYRTAGAGFLAYRLEKLFRKIETPEDTALHNDMLKEVLQMINGEEKGFFESIAELLIYKDKQPETRRKRFLFRVADMVLVFGQKNSTK